jgi:hypothetical protein
MKVKKRTWREFRSTGLLWFINRQLHLFGWVIAVDEANDEVYPARAEYEGFTPEAETRGYARVKAYMARGCKTEEEVV